ncbi:hypothetical protein [Streptomyces sp. NPDC048516]|uniref:hypothetical protein n=1 Tax=Streptomyces sp. NPDC048516 TaxID=3365565 RepID=UPI00370F979F
MRVLQTVTLLVATPGAGLMAGLFAAFAYAGPGSTGSSGRPGAPAGRPGALKAARESFEGRWVTWNIERALAHTAAFGTLAWALFLHRTAATG